MGLIDTHCHLNTYDEENLEEILRNAHNNDVEYIFVPGFDLNSSKKAVELASKYDFIYAIVGFHPCDCANLTDQDYLELEELAKHEKVIAIGECGLDYYWKDVPKDIQMVHFIKQIVLANKLKKPLVIHCREAISDTYEILKKYSKVKNLLHCYSGSFEMAKEFLKINCYLSFAGPLTFKNAKTPKEVASKIELDKLMIETDSPYLSPHPFRGKRNEPSYVKYVFDELKNLRKMEEKDLKMALKANCQAFFDKKFDKM